MAVAEPLMEFSIICDESDPDGGNLDLQFGVAAACGVRYVSYRSGNPSGKPGGNKRFADLTDGDIALIHAARKRYGLSAFATAASPLGKIKLSDVNDGNKAPFIPMTKYMKENVPRCIMIAANLEAPVIRIFSGYPPRGSDPLGYVNQSVDMIGGIASQANKPSMMVAIEIEQDLVGRNGDLLDKIGKQLAASGINNVCYAWDGGNVVAQGLDPMIQYERMKEGIGIVHAKDLKLRPELRTRLETVPRLEEAELADFVPIGTGDAQYPQILSDMRNPGRRAHLYRDKVRERLIPACYMGEHIPHALSVPVLLVDLESHEKGGGQFGGRAEPDGIGRGFRALTRVAGNAGWRYQLRDAPEPVYGKT